MDYKGKQNLPPQNMSFEDTDYFKLVIFKKQKTQKKLLTHSLYMPKKIQMTKIYFRTGTLTYSPQHIRIKCRRQAGSTQYLFLRFPSVSHCSGWSNNNLFIMFFALSHLPVNAYFYFEVPDSCFTFLRRHVILM